MERFTRELLEAKAMIMVEEDKRTGSLHSVANNSSVGLQPVLRLREYLRNSPMIIWTEYSL